MIETVIEGEWLHTSLPIEGHYTTRQFNVPEKEETYLREVPGHYETERQYIQGHYETQEIWIPEHEEDVLVEIPGYYESRTVQEPGQWVETRVLKAGYWEDALVTRPADPATGRLEISYWDKRWIPERWYTRKVWEEGRTRLIKFWVDTTWEMQTVTVPGGFRDHRVWIEGEYKDVELWVPTTMEQVTVLIPEHTESREVWVPAYVKHISIKRPDKTVLVETTWWDWEDKEFQEPIFGYADAPHTDNLELVSFVKGPEMVLIGEPEPDTLKIKIVPTGDTYQTDAEFLGCAMRIGDNEYVLPEKYWEQLE